MCGGLIMERIPIAGPSITQLEIDYAADAAAHGWYDRAGEYPRRFEQAFASYIGVKHAVSLPSCTSGLHLALAALGIGPGDEVIVPNRTWIATAHAPFLLGATVKLVDVEVDRPIINAKLIEQAITEKTRAIIPVHLCGRSADMRSINDIAQRHNLTVIEDTAQALGSRNADGFLGTFSDIGCFSLGVSKLISTGQGGVVVTRDQNTYEKLKLMN